MKKIFIVLFIFLISTASFGEIDFIDVSESDWYYTYVNTLVTNDITSGYGDQTFRPNNIITVEEFVTLTIKSIGETESDLEKNRWSDGFMDKARILAIVNDGEFSDISKPITRGEMARIVLRASKIEPPEDFMNYANKISDLNTMAPYWQNIAIRIYSTGIITGYADGTFGLNNNASRAEASVVLSKLLKPSLRAVPEVNAFDIRKSEIQVAWDKYKPLHSGDVFSQMPKTKAPYFEGELSESILQDGLNILKFIRTLAYLSDDIYLSDRANDLSQKGALLIAVSEFSHTPARPEDMEKTLYEDGYDASSSGNLAAGVSSLEWAIRRLMDDEDASNIDRLGHRRWQLHPDLKELGMGYVESEENYRYYSVVKVFKNLEREARDYTMTAWPSEKAFPIQFFGKSIPWSLTLNPSMYDNTRVSDISVELSQVNSGESWMFDSKDKDLNGKYFGVETSGYGIPYCIIFRPDPNEISSYDLNQIYQVKINNVYTVKGEKVTIEYETTFFNLK